MTPQRLIGTTRLVTGLILFAYVLSHDLNHALGLISLSALETGRHIFIAFWQFPPIRYAFYLSILLHMLIALRALFLRRNLRMPPGDFFQLTLGLALPPLLALHVLGTAVANLTFGVDPDYEYVVWSIWVAQPHYGLLQTAALLVAWIHGCIGLRSWLHLKDGYARWRDALYAAALIVPILSLLGFASAGRAVAELASSPGWVSTMLAAAKLPDAAGVARLYAWLNAALIGYVIALALVLIARLLRIWLRRRRAIEIRYADGHTVTVQPGTTVLEASRIGGVPHAAVCGGRGRCSTCRIKVISGAEHLPPANDDESKLLARIGAAPGTRLACQTRPIGPVAVAPLLPPMAAPRAALGHSVQHHGQEREIAVLFADLRGFTRFAEHRLPYDVVFLLNRYFRAMGEAVNASGGRVDKFIGDGVMALFGLTGTPQEACRQAVDAAARMSINLDQLNLLFDQDLKQPLRIGIGIHVGTVIVGEMGFAGAQALTAIGDTVNTASRLENATKEFDCQLLLSSEVAALAGLRLDDLTPHDIPLRGRSKNVMAYAFDDARTLKAEGLKGKTPRPDAAPGLAPVESS
ncbi:adenylate/guanylate cyclase domain-containing protein [Dongia soli]|uniref:Adenylate/guanylate cyclase domain-containing protein n=1 Tax=Dongia soli TaxID=600628 RepID=A0ABU5ED61_9PROT|nr:adenylate/guanylate cyclase domain-containing protein [Dongia soli]MDY0883980.1 adenylate/guanylate cyclase domain-containing protein [Dongia soli]